MDKLDFDFEYLVEESDILSEVKADIKPPPAPRPRITSSWDKWEPSQYTPKPYASYKFESGYLQPNHMTRPERFPKIFDSAQRLKPKAKRILSFGCSYGDEVAAIAKRFPDAEIVGVDIDHSAVTTARRNVKLPNVSFHDELEGTGKYDIILCLMVLFCMETPVPKDTWTNVLKKLDKHLNYNGLLMIYTSDYDPKEVLGNAYSDVNVWTHEHNKCKKQYFDGYYRKRRNIFSWLK